MISLHQFVRIYRGGPTNVPVQLFPFPVEQNRQMTHTPTAYSDSHFRRALSLVLDMVIGVAASDAAINAAA